MVSYLRIDQMLFALLLNVSMPSAWSEGKPSEDAPDRAGGYPSCWKFGPERGDARGRVRGQETMIQEVKSNVLKWLRVCVCICPLHENQSEKKSGKNCDIPCPSFWGRKSGRPVPGRALAAIQHSHFISSLRLSPSAASLLPRCTMQAVG
jgi:hypothetical protein